MGKEIERKFLVKNDGYKALASERIEICQGYISRDVDRTVRVRRYGDRGFITVKTRNEGAMRDEWEYEIPVGEAEEMLEKVCVGVIIAKTRYIVPCGDGMRWEVDEYGGSLTPLVTAEIELPRAECEVALPDFVGEEVTGDPHYYNSYLAGGV